MLNFLRHFCFFLSHVIHIRAFGNRNYKCIEDRHLSQKLVIAAVNTLWFSFIPSDIDECEDDTQPCGPSGECWNTEGSFFCSCDAGFVSTRDPPGCEGMCMLTSPSQGLMPPAAVRPDSQYCWCLRKINLLLCWKASVFGSTRENESKQGILCLMAFAYEPMLFFLWWDVRMNTPRSQRGTRIFLNAPSSSKKERGNIWAGCLDKDEYIILKWPTRN